jgi:hypothetical protein
LTLEKYRAWETVETDYGNVLHEVDVDEIPHSLVPDLEDYEEDQEAGFDASGPRVDVDLDVEDSEQGELFDFGGDTE